MRKSRVIALTAAVSVIPISASAQVATFQVDPSVSSLTVSGTALGAPILTQGPGSLTTTYQGPLLVQLGSDSISFFGGSAVAADNSGSWQPLPGGASGSAPANYGGRVVILFVTSLAAVRDAIFDSTSAALPITSGSFSSAINFTATSGNIDFNSPVGGMGTDTIVGSTATNNSPNPGTLNIVAGAPGFASAALFLPVSFTIISDLGGLGEGVFNFNGSMTARATARGGDANFDGTVNLIDFNTLAANFGTTSGATWLAGDFTFDGIVNLNDFNVLAGNFGLTASQSGPSTSDWSALASAIPEPAMTMLLPLAGFAIRRNRRN